MVMLQSQEKASPRKEARQTPGRAEEEVPARPLRQQKPGDSPLTQPPVQEALVTGRVFDFHRYIVFLSTDRHFVNETE